MSIIQALILGLIQGLTEFIPVSSSGHLVVLHEAMNISQDGLAFDVALHFGTFAALVLYFYKDIIKLSRAFFVKTNETKLARLIAFATVPAVVAGVLLENLAETTFRSSKLVAVNLFVVGVLMIVAETVNKKYKHHTTLGKTSTRQALAMGTAQAIALVPGVSRSGITITTGIFAGLERVAATRFSFLLAIPITFGAIVKVLLDGGTVSQIGSEAGVFITGIIAAFASGLFAIRFLINYLSKHSLAVFAYYRMALAVIIILAL